MGVLAAGAAMVFASGAMAAPDEAARKLLPDDIKQKGLLIAAMPLDFEPFNYLDAQNAQMGLDVDLFNAIGDVLGLKTEIQRMGFASIVLAVKGGARACWDVGDGHSRGAPAARLCCALRPFQQRPDREEGQPGQRPQRPGCGAKIAAEKGTQPPFLWQKIADKCAADGKPKPEITIFDGKGPQVLAVRSGAPTRRPWAIDRDRRGRSTPTQTAGGRAVRFRAAPWSAASPSPRNAASLAMR
jgi:polar amino acid transport system substrate-binding protein